MRNIFSTQWKYGNMLLNIAIVVCFTLIAYYHLNSGYSMSTDSKRFSKWADDLIRLDFNLYEFFSIDINYNMPSLFFYSVPVVLIALCKVIFVNEWQFAFLILNLSFVFFSIIIFVKSLLLIKVRPVLISLTLPVIVASVDILIWPKFILSDMIYAFLVLLSVYLIIKGIIKDKINYLEISIIIFLLLASRPSSISAVFAILSFIIISKFPIFMKQKNILLFILITFISTPFLLSLVYFFIEFYFDNIAKIDFYTDMVKNGMIIHDRPETWVNQPKNFIDIVYIYFLRLINFLIPMPLLFNSTHSS